MPGTKHFGGKADEGKRGGIEDNEPVEGERDSPSEQRCRSSDRDHCRTPEIVTGPGDHPNENPTAGDRQPDQRPETNPSVHAHHLWQDYISCSSNKL